VACFQEGRGSGHACFRLEWLENRHRLLPVSAKVGWAGKLVAMWRVEKFSFMATTHSWMRAEGPTVCAPTTWSLSASAIILARPSAAICKVGLAHLQGKWGVMTTQSSGPSIL